MNAIADRTLLAVSVGALGSSFGDEVGAAMREANAFQCHRVLAHLLASANHLPRLEAQAHGAYRDWLVRVRPAVDASDGKSIADELERQLDLGVHANVEGAVQRLCRHLADIASARDLLREAASIERAYRSGFMSAYRDLLGDNGDGEAGQGAVALPHDAARRLEKWLRGHVAGAGDLALGAVEIIPGGFSKQTLLVRMVAEGGASVRLVIRMDRADSPQETSTLDEYLVLKALFDAGVRVPQPLALEPAGDVLGGTFMVMEHVAGSDIGDPLDVRGDDQAVALDLAREMARVHQVRLDSFSTRLPGTHQSPRERLLAEIEEYEGHWRATGIHSIALELAFGWLRRNIGLADGPRTLIHRDLGPHNLLAADGRLTAIIDWEQAAIGTPAQDLADLYQFAVQLCGWDSFLAAYVEEGGSGVPVDRFDYYTLWAFTWRMVNVVRAMSAFPPSGGDIRYAYAATYFAARFQARLMEQVTRLI